MFGKMLKMEFARAFHPYRLFLVIILIVVLMFASSNINSIAYVIEQGGMGTIGSIDQMSYLFFFAIFETVMIVLLAGLYTGSFCKDDNSRYLRMILTRTNVKAYTWSRFLANVCIILAASVICMYLYVLILRPYMPLLPVDGPVNSYYYRYMVENHPVLYVGMTGIIFGLLASACSSVGVLYSAYDSNSFVSIALSGLVFYVAISYIPLGTPFNILNLAGMASTIGTELPEICMYLWTHVYMLAIVGICGFLFYRRMKWRVENGYL